MHVDSGGLWEDHQHLVEFTYNNHFQASIKMTHFKALYGKKYRSTVYWDDIRKRKLLGLEMFTQMMDKINLIYQHLKTAQDRLGRY